MNLLGFCTCVSGSLECLATRRRSSRYNAIPCGKGLWHVGRCQLGVAVMTWPSLVALKSCWFVRRGNRYSRILTQAGSSRATRQRRQRRFDSSYFVTIVAGQSAHATNCSIRQTHQVCFAPDVSMDVAREVGCPDRQSRCHDLDDAQVCVIGHRRAPEARFHRRPGWDHRRQLRVRLPGRGRGRG